jgi:hypothetical protein
MPPGIHPIRLVVIVYVNSRKFCFIYSVRWRDPVHETGAHRRIGIEEATTEEKVNTKPAGNRKKRKLEWIPFPPIISPTTTRFSFIICLKPFCFVFFFFRCGGRRIIYYYPLLPLFNIQLPPVSWKTQNKKRTKQINKKETINDGDKLNLFVVFFLPIYFCKTHTHIHGEMVKRVGQILKKKKKI